MMNVSEFTNYLKTQFAGVSFYTGTIDKNKSQCIGVYLRSGAGKSILAIGGKSNTSYGALPISLVIHWTEDSDLCETQANSIYELLLGKSDFTIGSRRIVSVDLVDPGPVDISRDSNNICEMVIRLIIYYGR